MASADISNFLATDKVPDTIFGIPIVSREEDYTEEDVMFFRDHPEAGGYYDMGEGTPEDGTEEGAPVQKDEPQKGKYASKYNEAVPDKVLRDRGRSVVNPEAVERQPILLLRKGGFRDVPGKNTALTEELLDGRGLNDSFFRITLPDGRPLEYAVGNDGQLHIPTVRVNLANTSESLWLARTLVALHGDPKTPGYTRNGVSVDDVANNIWTHARVAQGSHQTGSVGRAVAYKNAAVADINNGDWRMAMAEIADDPKMRWGAVRLAEEFARRQRDGLPVDGLFSDDRSVVDPATGAFTDLDEYYDGKANGEVE